MAAAKNRYFLASVPPPPIFDQAWSVKQYFKTHFDSSASLNSPPHVTLHMPFEWKTAEESRLVEALTEFAVAEKTFTIQLKNFGCFSPRVIFIDVVSSSELNELQKKLARFCRYELNILNADYRDLPFHPHLTVAFRDLKKPDFIKAWEEFKHKSFNDEYLVNEVSLLKHDGVKWNVCNKIQLGQSG